MLLLTEQFRPKDPDTQEHSRAGTVWAIAALMPSVVLAAAVLKWGTFELFPFGSLLTSTSILTGITFSQAVVLWNRSIDIRKDVNYAFDGKLLTIVDQQRALLTWTTLVGVAATGLLVVITVLPGTQGRWAFALVSAICLYQVILVGQGLLRFFRLSYLLR